MLDLYGHGASLPSTHTSTIAHSDKSLDEPVTWKKVDVEGGTLGVPHGSTAKSPKKNGYTVLR